MVTWLRWDEGSATGEGMDGGEFVLCCEHGNPAVLLNFFPAGFHRNYVPGLDSDSAGLAKERDEKRRQDQMIRHSQT